MMLKIIFTPQMKDYLRQEMVLSDFEIKKLLEAERARLGEEIRQAQDRIKAINLELAEIAARWEG